MSKMWFVFFDQCKCETLVPVSILVRVSSTKIFKVLNVKFIHIMIIRSFNSSHR